MMMFKHLRSLTLLIVLGGVLALAPSGVTARSPESSDAAADHVLNLPLILRNFQFGPASFAGKVVDATTNQPINNAEVCLTTSSLPADICQITEEDGTYLFEGVLVGISHSLEAKHQNYFPVTKFAAAATGVTKTVNFALPPSILDGDYLVLLTWSSTKFWSPGVENDLDAYMWTPFLSPGNEVIHQANRGSKTLFPYVYLDIDVRQGSGPETITIVQSSPGIYSYGVDNFNAGKLGVPPISGTGANVQLYNVGGLVKEYNVPEGGNKNFWYVFDLNADTGELTDVNCLTDYPTLPARPVCPEPLQASTPAIQKPNK